MKSSFAVLSLALFGGVIVSPVAGMAKSLITIQEFPKTYADVPFAQRIENEDMDYDAWDSVYDENGNCISGCAYYGIRLQDELEMMENATNQLAADLRAEERRGGPGSSAGAGSAPGAGGGTGGSGTIPGSGTGAGGGAGGAGSAPGAGGGTGGSGTIPGSIAGAGGGAGGAGSVPGAGGGTGGSDGTYTCKTGAYSAHANESGFISPLDRDLVVTSVVGPRNVRGGSVVHAGIDLRGGPTDKIYAAYQGKVVLAKRNGNAGNEVRIKHTINGNTYYTRYLHMSKIAVNLGDEVAKGCYIGNVGGSGTTDNAYSVHLHYTIGKQEAGFGERGIIIDPLRSCVITKSLEWSEWVEQQNDGRYDKFYDKDSFIRLKAGNNLATYPEAGRSYLNREYKLKHSVKKHNPVVSRLCSNASSPACTNCFPQFTGFTY